MKQKAINILLTLILLCGIGVSQSREPKPVTQASLVKSLLTLANKAELAGRDKDARVIMQAASIILNSK